MMKLTKKELQDEIVMLANNIEVYEALVGDASVAKNTLALYRAQLHALEEAESNANLNEKDGK